jgi:hypothetical protein
MMLELRKYVRTPHIQGSRLQRGDHDMEAVPWEELAGKHLVVEEKVDGSQTGISFSEDGKLLLQSRGHYLRGGPREKQFDVLKQWAAARQEELFCILGSRYVMYGEWLFAAHTCYYDALPHYFMEFDVLDTEPNEFLSTPARDKLLRFASDVVHPVLVLAAGEFSALKELEAMIGRSKFITDDRVSSFLSAAVEGGQLHGAFGNKEIQEAMATKDWDPRMEGLYVKWEDEHVVKGRYKFVRSTFTSAILDQETHWHDRPIVQNKLVPGAYERMFQ